MRKVAVVLILVGLVMSIFSLAIAQEKADEKAPAKAEHKYIGSLKCKVCHNSPAKGAQFKIWSESKHAKAFEALATPEAKAAGEKLGVTNPQESDKCLSCHVTGFAAPATAKDASYTQAEGVGCEACHGPGSDYKDMKVMKDQKAAIAAGLAIPTKETCVGCHNEKSPTFKGFNYEESWKKIAHSIPAETAK